ncbi:MAG: cysteine synthase A [Proteobacteria bacterium]|nr:cysteine synthase A [Pseudomonadota bacterium]
MNIVEGFTGAIGNTPLIKLETLSEITGCNILAKAEFMNPGGSVKDRAALSLIQQAENSGQLKSGGTVVEGTAGNTGIGLAHICNARGYKCVIVIPETQSQEKMDNLRLLGAEVRPIPAVPFKNPENYVHVAKRIADETENSVWANQFDNTANRDAHFDTTGPEIWQQTDATVDGFICATGTGGTLAGIGRYLKQQRPDVCIALADPSGSVLAQWVLNGELKLTGDGSITEGIGNGRVTANLQGTEIDTAVTIGDQITVDMVYHLLYHEGLLVGASSGLNVAAAVWLAGQLGPGKTIVTLLTDHGSRYQSRLFNQQWLESKNLVIPARARRFELENI